MNRRDFLIRQAGLTGLAAGPFSTWLSLRGVSLLAQQQPAPPTDYRALVCVFLAGGNDSFNMLIPAPGPDATSDWAGATSSPLPDTPDPADTPWQGFRRIRSALNTGHLFQQQNTALSSGVLPLNAGSVAAGTAPTTSLQHLALHGRMPRLQAIFNGTGYAPGTNQAFTPSGRHAAFITGLGPLSEPLTPEEARQFLSRRPRLLQSHNDQILQWQTCFPQGSSSTGWAGRLADQVSSIAHHPFSLVSLDGVVPALLGSRARHFTDAAGNARVSSFLGQSTARRTALKSLLTEQLNTGAPTQVLTHAYTRTLLDGITHNEDWATTLSGTTAPADALNVGNAHGLTAKLRRVAHIVKAGQASAAASGTFPRRQVFFVTLGGWDHHNGAAKDHFTYLDILDQSLAEFYAQMQALGALNAVTLFTASDFGRALVPNGDGTDHAWAGNHIVMGGAVNGGKIYGQYPDMLTASRSTSGQLISDSPGQDLTGNGTFVPSLSVDQYMQRMGQWFLQGVNTGSWNTANTADAKWTDVLPNWGALRTNNPTFLTGFMGI